MAADDTEEESKMKMVRKQRMTALVKIAEQTMMRALSKKRKEEESESARGSTIRQGLTEPEGPKPADWNRSRESRKRKARLCTPGDKNEDEPEDTQEDWDLWIWTEDGKKNCKEFEEDETAEPPYGMWSGVAVVHWQSCILGNEHHTRKTSRSIQSFGSQARNALNVKSILEKVNWNKGCEIFPSAFRVYHDKEDLGLLVDATIGSKTEGELSVYGKIRESTEEDGIPQRKAIRGSLPFSTEHVVEIFADLEFKGMTGKWHQLRTYHTVLATLVPREYDAVDAHRPPGDEEKCEPDHATENQDIGKDDVEEDDDECPLDKCARMGVNVSGWCPAMAGRFLEGRNVDEDTEYDNSEEDVEDEEKEEDQLPRLTLSSVHPDLRGYVHGDVRDVWIADTEGRHGPLEPGLRMSMASSSQERSATGNPNTGDQTQNEEEAQRPTHRASMDWCPTCVDSRSHWRQDREWQLYKAMSRELFGPSDPEDETNE